MKNRVLFVFAILALFVLINGVYAISTDLKQTYQRSETAVVKISGNIMNPITPSQVSLLKGHDLFPMVSDVKKIGNDYYVWFISPSQESNYTLRISGINTVVNGNVQSIDYLQNFSVSGNMSDYYINPGFISTGNDFDIKVTVNSDNSQSINVNYISGEQVNLNPGYNTLHFAINEISSTGVYTITIGKYSIPAYLIFGSSQNNNSSLNNTQNNTQNNTNSTNGNNTILPPQISIIPDKINFLILNNTNTIFPVVIRNYGSNNLSNVSISFDPNLFNVYPNTINLNANETNYFNLTIKSTSKIITSNISINYFSYSFNIPVFINITGNTTYLQNQTNNNYLGHDCITELGGSLCSASDTCSASSVSSVQGACCLGKCIPQSAPSGNNSLFGWLLGIALVAVLGYVFFRYRKVKSAGNPIQKQVESIESKDKLKKLS